MPLIFVHFLPGLPSAFSFFKADCFGTSNRTQGLALEADNCAAELHPWPCKVLTPYFKVIPFCMVKNALIFFLTLLAVFERNYTKKNIFNFHKFKISYSLIDNFQGFYTQL